MRGNGQSFQDTDKEGTRKYTPNIDSTRGRKGAPVCVRIIACKQSRLMRGSVERLGQQATPPQAGAVPPARVHANARAAGRWWHTVAGMHGKGGMARHGRPERCEAAADKACLPVLHPMAVAGWKLGTNAARQESINQSINHSVSFVISRSAVQIWLPSPSWTWASAMAALR